MAKDYYSLLGVDKGATDDEIKKAFRKAAHKYHPDKDGGDEAKFKEINEAYQVLGNKQKRVQYDQFGSAFNNAGMGGGQGGFGGAGGFNWQDFARQAGAQGNARANYSGSYEDLGDIFGDIFGFGGTRRSSRSRRQGEDIQVEMNISFEDAVFGDEKNIQINKEESCDKCNGKGHESGVKIETCPECKGSGRVVTQQRTILGVFQSESICPTCKGEGKKPEKFCSKCHGQTRVRTKKDLKIKIPAGINSGETIKLSGQGNDGPSGTASGDLYITFQVSRSKEFERKGYDIHTKTSINFSQAALGDKIPVKTIHGNVNLKIPAGTQSGKDFILKNKGVSILGREGSRGDHIVRVIVETPQKVSRGARKLFEELEKEL